MIKTETRAQIKGYLEGFIQSMIEHYKSSPLKPYELRPPKASSKTGDIKPFHEAIIPDGLLRITEFERSFSTKLGNTFEEVARLIGQDNFIESQRKYIAKGMLSTAAISTIESIANSIRKSGMQQSFLELIDMVIRTHPGNQVERSRQVDLYLKDRKGNEFYFEMKSPKPNMGQCIEVTDRLLQIHAMKRATRPGVNTFYAMAYNPYGKREHYTHSFALRYLDIKNEVLIGKEFWDLIGGEGTYEEVLGIYREVGREKGRDMIDQLMEEF